MSFGKTIRSINALPLFEKFLFIKAILFLPFFQFCVLFLPLSYLIKIFSLTQQPIESISQQNCPPTLYIVKIKWVIDTIDRKMPFWPGLCLAQALTARKLLKDKQISCILYLGATLNTKSSMKAHAWLCNDSFVITGARHKDSFTPLAAFL